MQLFSPRKEHTFLKSVSKKSSLSKGKGLSRVLSNKTLSNKSLLKSNSETARVDNSHSYFLKDFKKKCPQNTLNENNQLKKFDTESDLMFGVNAPSRSYETERFEFSVDLSQDRKQKELRKVYNYNHLIVRINDKAVNIIKGKHLYDATENKSSSKLDEMASKELTEQKDQTLTNEKVSSQIKYNCSEENVTDLMSRKLKKKENSQRHQVNQDSNFTNYCLQLDQSIQSVKLVENNQLSLKELKFQQNSQSGILEESIQSKKSKRQCDVSESKAFGQTCLKTVCASRDKENLPINKKEKIKKGKENQLKVSSSVKQFSKILEKKGLKQSLTVKKDWSLKDFDIGRKIGKGRLGKVFMVQEKSTKTVFALKVLDIEQIKNEQMEEQISLEIKLQMYLNHPNILKLYSFFREQDKLYLILELADCSLFKKLRKQCKFSEQIVAYYARQMIQAMKYFHPESILHRDIKPENIMLAFDCLKLGDWGWAAYAPQFKRQTFCGTMDYVPPEIITGEFYDEKVDVWSLGVLIYELAVGCPPFETANQTQNETFDRILINQLQFPAHLSQDLCELLKEILQSDPQKRISPGQIECSPWMKKYEKQGVLIEEEIFTQWMKIRDNQESR